MVFAIGLMSGTSFDGVDGVIFDELTNKVVKHHYIAYEAPLRKMCCDISTNKRVSIEALAELTSKITKKYELVIEALLLDNSQDISIIGVHGQTIKHVPNGAYPFTVQLINASLLATKFLIPVACDFRSNDLFLGGQGAPLSPAFHNYLFDLNDQTVVLNLGGIANITYIDCKGNLCGFDTGPANCLLDLWIKKNKKLTFDNKGQWASTGTVIPALLSHLMAHGFIKQTPPKSADKEDFSLAWLESLMIHHSYMPEDVQATLLMFTVKSILKDIKSVSPNCNSLMVCGGGAYNSYMMSQLSENYNKLILCSDLGYENNHIEAMMIAWLAIKRHQEEAVELQTITGASRATVLGAIYLP